MTDHSGRRPAISTKHLSLADVPDPEAADWGDIQAFALTFDGYRAWGSFEQCAEVANGVLAGWRAGQPLPSSLKELRTCLFFEQRRWHHFGAAPDDAAMRYLQALLRALRQALAGPANASRDQRGG